MQGLAIVATTWQQSEASVIRSLLEAHGIPCEIICPMPQRIYPVAAEGLAEIRILVPPALEEEALSILEAYRRPDSPLRPV